MRVSGTGHMLRHLKRVEQVSEPLGCWISRSIQTDIHIAGQDYRRGKRYNRLENTPKFIEIHTANMV